MMEPVIINGARTAVGKFGGSLKDVPLVELGRTVIREAVLRAGLKPGITEKIRSFRPDSFGDFDRTAINEEHYEYPEELDTVYFDEVIMGNVIQAGLGQNPARQASIYAGMPEETGAYTVNKVCASGMKAIALASQAIKAGDGEMFVAGGMENMSRAPYLLPKARWGYRMDMYEGSLVDAMVHDGLWEIFNGYHMGMTAENIAEKYHITREEQDELGVLSHKRAMDAIKSGEYAEEIVPVLIPQRKGEPISFDTDERPMETNMEKMSRLSPAFKKDGTVTAGNSSGINDAAAAVVLTSSEKAEELGKEPLARIKGYASGGVDPAYMGLGPIPATRKLLNKLNITMDDVELVELNEAFAVQALACMRELKIDVDKTNLLGSGISIGHPIGATGARIVYGLAMQMKEKGLGRGLATLCIGGGQGMAMLLERD